MLKLKNKIVLVTGGAGFIGSHLSGRLIRENAKVIVFDNLSTGNLDNIKEFRSSSHFKFIKGDVNKYKDIKKVFLRYKIDYIFHLAAVVGVERIQKEPLSALNDIDGFKNILRLSLENKIKKIIFSSSSEAYGNPVELPEKEDGAHNPGARDTYALTKLIGENMFMGYYEKYKLPAVALRFFNVYGPRQESSHYGFVTGIFIKQVLKNKRPTVFGDGMMTRDFVYIDDNIEAQIRALLIDKANGKVINVGMGRQTTIIDLAERIIRLCHKNISPVFVNRRKADIRYRCPDITKLKKILNYSPKVGLDDGLKKTISWYKENI